MFPAVFKAVKDNCEELVRSELAGTSTSFLYRAAWSRDWQMTRLQVTFFLLVYLYCIKEGIWLFRSIFVSLENITFMSFRSLLRYVLLRDLLLIRLKLSQEYLGLSHYLNIS